MHRSYIWWIFFYLLLFCLTSFVIKSNRNIYYICLHVVNKTNVIINCHFSSFSLSLSLYRRFFDRYYQTGTITVAGKEIPWKTILEHCWTSGILVIITANRDTSENLVSKSTCKSETFTGSWNWKDSYGTNGTNDRHNAIYEHGQYWLLCSTRCTHGKCNASIVAPIYKRNRTTHHKYRQPHINHIYTDT